VDSTLFFVSDLHGDTKMYDRLFQMVEEENPAAVFLGGDLLPSGLLNLVSTELIQKDYINGFLGRALLKLKEKMSDRYPRIFVILGNDDSKSDEENIIKLADAGLWEYIHNRKVSFGEYTLYGYSYVPPSPFRLKDFERYDVSRYVDPGCLPPEEGMYSVPVNRELIKIQTIKKDLDILIDESDLSKSILLFHSPPYQTKLDRADLDGKSIEHVPLDVHIGSIAIKRMIQKRQPLITLHGHVHESARITGEWQEKINTTFAFSAAHDGSELALVRFDPNKPELATRTLIPC